jgi:DNA segregation ATPase FtsK/SpoIIIE, S-DNA-T family
VLASRPLPEMLSGDAVASVAGSRSDPEVALTSVIGIADVTGGAVMLDLRRSHAAVIGPPHSGRSTALLSIAAGWSEEHHVSVIGPASSPLTALPARHRAFGRVDRVYPVLERLADLLDMGAPTRPTVLVIDDLDGFDDLLLTTVWERLAASEQLRIVASIEPRAVMGFSANPVVAEMRRARQTLVMAPDDPNEFLQLTGVKLPQRPGLRCPPGRGVLIADRTATIVQVAVPAISVSNQYTCSIG